MTICDCLILFALHIVGKVRYNWIGLRAVELNTANAKMLKLPNNLATATRKQAYIICDIIELLWVVLNYKMRTNCLRNVKNEKKRTFGGA